MSALDTPANEHARADLSREITSLRRLFDDLSPLARGLARSVSVPGGTVAKRDDLATLRPVIHNLLAARRGFITGAGVITAPGVLADAPLWLEWWWTAADGPPEALRVNLDDTTPDFFDYTSTEWFAVPMADRRPHAAGPYVDYFCTNQYTITFAVPVGGDESIGVAAADVLITSLELRLVPILRRIGHNVVLANAEGRVIASATPMLAPGDLVDLRDDGDVELAGGGHDTSVAALGYRLVEDPRPSAAAVHVVARR